MKKSIIAVSTVAVVALGVFLGVKLMAKPNSSQLDNTAMLQDKKSENKKTEEKSNFLSDNLKAKEKKVKDNKETITDEKDNKDNEDKKDNKNNITNDEDNNNKRDKDKRFRGENKEPLLEKKDDLSSKPTNSNEVEIYDDQYVVKKGDNLFTIGKRFFVKENITEGITLIKNINKINDNDLIKVGDKLNIPTENNFESKKEEVKGQKLYTVKSGDTLTSIAEKEMNWCNLETGIKLLREMNKLQNDNIQKDQKISIPTEMTK